MGWGSPGFKCGHYLIGPFANLSNSKYKHENAGAHRTRDDALHIPEICYGAIQNVYSMKTQPVIDYCKVPLPLQFGRREKKVLQQNTN